MTIVKKYGAVQQILVISYTRLTRPLYDVRRTQCSYIIVSFVYFMLFHY